MSNEVIKITDINGFGDGVGRLTNGKTVFVPCTLPGDEISICDIKHEKRFAKALIAEILKPAKSRIKPFCPHFGICGSCRLQCAAEQTYEELKLKIFNAQTHSVSQYLTVNSLHRGQKTVAYRNRCSFQLLPDTGQPSYVDLTNRPFAVETCPILAESIQNVLSTLNRFLTKNRGKQTFDGFFRNIVRLNIEAIAGHNEKPILGLALKNKADYKELLSEIQSAFGGIYDGIFLCGNMFGCRWLYHPQNTLHFDNEEIDIIYRPGVFRQTNSEVANLIRDTVRQHCLKLRPQAVWELYCGYGQFLFRMVEQIKQGIGFEANADACAIACEYARQYKLTDKLNFYTGDVPEVLLDCLRDKKCLPADIWILNPPRAGLGNIFFRTLVKDLPPQIFYISCNPQSLARDLQNFIKQGYKSQICEIYDMFPQTPHVETVVLMSRVDK